MRLWNSHSYWSSTFTDFFPSLVMPHSKLPKRDWEFISCLKERTLLVFEGNSSLKIYSLVDCSVPLISTANVQKGTVYLKDVVAEACMYVLKQTTCAHSRLAVHTHNLMMFALNQKKILLFTSHTFLLRKSKYFQKFLSIAHYDGLVAFN